MNISVRDTLSDFDNRSTEFDTVKKAFDWKPSMKSIKPNNPVSFLKEYECNPIDRVKGNQ